MTENEAKTKWCPFVRIAVLDGANRGSVSDHDMPLAKCIGAACMAWRWAVTPRQAAHGAPAGGYCGLAGKS